MSEIPGYTMEDFLKWDLRIKVEDDDDPDFNAIGGEMFGGVKKRPTIPNSVFQNEIVKVFEPYREQIERKLDNFDDEETGWRDYAGHAFDFIPEEVYDYVNKKIEEYG